MAKTAVKEVQQGTHRRPDGKLSWDVSDLAYMHKFIGEKAASGVSISAACDLLATEWASKIPGITGRAISARFYLYDGSKHVKKKDRLVDATRSRKVSEARSSVSENGTHTAAKPRSRKRRKVSSQAPVVQSTGLLGQLEEYVTQLEAQARDAEARAAEAARRAAAAEARAQKAQKKLTYLHRITATA